MNYDHESIESKWQKRWMESGVFEAKDDSEKEKFYALVEFPYPSGAGLHIGHPRSYAALDIIARKKRMEGMNVLYPIGWDAFGLPTENHAIKTGKKPKDVTKENTDNFRRQLQALGISFDWSREINTTDPEYYKWTQWMFLQFYKEGLAYKDKIAINWCTSCKIGLANEEVVNGVCERCDGEVEKRDKEQWMIAITKYAQRLLDDLETVDYMPKIKKQQADWIGRSEGAEVNFELDQDLTGYTVVGLHGYRRDSSSAFLPWLSKELKSRGAKVKFLDLPDPAEPKINEQVDFILGQHDFDEKTILVTHSLGGVAAMKLCEKLENKISKLIMVAPPVRWGDSLDGKERPYIDSCCDWNFDFATIKSKANSIIVLADENDHLLPLDHQSIIARELDAKLAVTQAKEAHFNGLQEPDILKELVPSIQVFTTRPDTLFGATYMVLAPEHELVSKITTEDQKAAVEKYISDAGKKTDIERGDATKEKTGVFTGAYAINPVNGERIPVWVADYVMMGYGTGAIMAVPAHDERDFDFATKFELSIRAVVIPGFVGQGAKDWMKSQNETEEDGVLERIKESVSAGESCYWHRGLLINSGEFDGLTSDEAISKIIDWLEESNFGKATVNFKLRDWVFSRQRYWGEPIPLVHCEKCDWVPVPEDQLPVELPDVERYEPTDTGESPLAAIEDWVNTTCPKCGGAAKRETDTMPNWAGSSWYFLRYADPHNTEAFADKSKLEYWTPVDLYNGGMEHTTLHLLYSRFWHKFMFDQGHVPTAEPYARRHSHGLLLGDDGAKISKSKGNGASPDDVVEKYGADTLRVYEMFIGPFEEPAPWNDNGLVGVRRFLDKVVRLSEIVASEEPEAVTRVLHKTIKKVTEDIDGMRFNTAVSQMMVFTNEVQSAGAITKDSFMKFLQVLCPFAPHIANELAEQIGYDGILEEGEWPMYDEKLTVDELVNIAVQVNGKLRGEVQTAPDASQEEVEKSARADEGVNKYLEGGVKKVIYVGGRLINFVV